MHSTRGALILSLILIACGDDDGGTKQPDAAVIIPQPDARTCLSVTSGTIEFFQKDEGNGVIQWIGEIGGAALPGGNQQFYRLEFYDGIEASLAGTFDLAAGNQANYKTCAICLRGIVGMNNTVTKQYFQMAGTITLTMDPYDTRRLVGTVAGLQMQEVDIADDYTSTPVAGGACATFTDYTLDADHAPSAWTCPAANYDDDTNCNCLCGAPDTDCYDNPMRPVMGCTTVTDTCFNDACVAVPANDTCQTAVPLTLPLAQAVTGTTAGAGRNYDQGLDTLACTNVAQRGPDVVYSVVLTDNQQITVTLSGLGAMHDGSISLVGPGAATICDAMPIAACVKGADTGNDGENDTFMYTTAASGGAGTYYIIVDGYGVTEGGPFTLNVTSP